MDRLAVRIHQLGVTLFESPALVARWVHRCRRRPRGRRGPHARFRASGATWAGVGFHTNSGRLASIRVCSDVATIRVFENSFRCSSRIVVSWMLTERRTGRTANSRSSSMLSHRRPSSSAASPVVFDPAKISTTKSSGSVRNRIVEAAGAPLLLLASPAADRADRPRRGGASPRLPARAVRPRRAHHPLRGAPGDGRRA